MGWLQLRERAKQHRQQTKKRLAGDVNQPTVFSNAPVDRSDSYECVHEANDTPVTTGMDVRLIDMNNRIDIYAGNKPVGKLEAEHAQRMRSQQRLAERKGRSVQGRIGNVSKLTNTFTVSINEE